MGFIAPSLPENAPFSPLQRAWLDGFIAGLFGDGDRVAAGTIEAPAAAREPEDFPWHDPGMPLDERVALAAGRRPERVLMAAMAQTRLRAMRLSVQDLRRGDRVRRRDEPQPLRARRQSDLAQAEGAGGRTGHAGGGATGGAGGFCRRHTVPRPASRGQSAGRTVSSPVARGAKAAIAPARKRTRGWSCSTPTSALRAIGSATASASSRATAPELVSAIITCLGVRSDTPVLSPDGIERPLIEALSECVELRRPSDQAIEVLASRALDIEESRILQAIAEGYPGAGPDDADLLDLLDAFPSARPPLSELISALDPLRPRLYSIASSPKHAAGEVHLTVAAVRYEKRSRRRTGVASTFLCDRIAPGETVSVYVHPAEAFRLAAPDAPVIMIGPGTGIAPFRAFLQERQAIGARGRNWLFFGNPHRRSDFFFEDELTAYHRDGLLTRLDTAFSRDQEHKIYVQHRLLEHAGELMGMARRRRASLCLRRCPAYGPRCRSGACLHRRQGRPDATGGRQGLSRPAHRRGPLSEGRLLKPIPATVREAGRRQ